MLTVNVYSQARGINDAVLPHSPTNTRSNGIYSDVMCDIRTKFIVFVDSVDRTFWKVNFDGSNLTAISVHNNKGVRQMAYDYLAKQIYYVDTTTNDIHTMHVDNPNTHRVILDSISNPTSVAVAPVYGYLFFATVRKRQFIADFLVYRTPFRVFPGWNCF